MTDAPALDMDAVRAQTLARLERLGVEVVHRRLPPLDPPPERLDAARIADRCLALNAALAGSFGLEEADALAWCERHGVTEALSRDERAMLDEPSEERALVVQYEVEALWALTWALGLHDDFDPTRPCTDDLVDLLPAADEESDDAVAAFRRHVARDPAEVVVAADVLYVLHWVWVNHRLAKTPEPSGVVEEWTVERRRHALDWALADEQWDEITLDT